MFKFLKEKIDSWTKKVKEKAEEKEKEEIKETKKKEKEQKKQIKAEKKEGKKQKTKEIEVPTKFNAGTQKIEPDLEKLQKIAKEINEEVHFEPSLDDQLRGKTIGKGLELGEEKKAQKVIKIQEEATEEEKKKSIFQRFGEKISKITISEKEFKDYEEELEMILLENNVALEVAEKIVKKLKEDIVGKAFLKKEIEFEIKTSLGDIIREILISPSDLIEEIKEKNLEDSRPPYVILFCGINGSGKTTTIAKIAEHLKSKKISCVIAAGDTFRAASIEQIKTHGEKIGVKVITHDYGADPASVGFDAIQYAKKNSINCVLIDTAGRMHTQTNLLREMQKIVKVCKPDKKFFVGESITGNDAVEQVKSFDETVGIDGIVLTKADIDEKGGTALSVGYVTKKPIFYLGTGQEYDKIEPFNKEKFIEKLGL
jgi:fused signal recognition particle receptor